MFAYTCSFIRDDKITLAQSKRIRACVRTDKKEEELQTVSAADSFSFRKGKQNIDADQQWKHA